MNVFQSCVVAGFRKTRPMKCPMRGVKRTPRLDGFDDKEEATVPPARAMPSALTRSSAARYSSAP